MFRRWPACRQPRNISPTNYRIRETLRLRPPPPQRHLNRRQADDGVAGFPVMLIVIP